MLRFGTCRAERITTGFPNPIFALPLNDLGAGVVNTEALGTAGVGTATFVRATTAWTKLSTGLWKKVATGLPRSTYLGASTAVGAYAGYLQEADAIQLVTPDAAIRDMTDASWIATTMTVAKTATGIDGVANSASRLTATGIGATVLQTLLAAGSSRTYSVFLRRVTGSGTVKLVQGISKSADFASSLNTSTYTRFIFTASVVNSAFGIELGTSGDVIEADFNQFEAGWATSPMDAAGAARNADVLSYVTASNIVGTIGTSSLEATTQWNNTMSSIGSPIALGTWDGGAGGIAIAYNGTSGKMYMYDGASTDMGLFAGSTTVTKFAAIWSVITMGIYINGTPTTGTFDGDMSLQPVLYVGGQGSGTGGNWSGTLKNVRIFNSVLSAAQVALL